jgi:hypothetical protein
MRMNMNRWTSALVSAGVVSTAALLQAEEAAQHPVVSALQSTTLSGYVNTSAIVRIGEDSAVYGRSYDGVDKHNGFNLDVVSLALEKPLDESEWSAGYRAQLLFGPDANLLGSLSPLAGSTGDFAIKNAYVSLRAPLGSGLKLKMGVWDTIMGYEVFDAGNNPNYSRSFGFYLEPIIHTGLLATYDFADWLRVNAGVANGIESRAAFNKINSRVDRGGSWDFKELSYVGSVALTAPESLGFLQGATIYGGIMYGGFGQDALGGNDIINYYAGATLPTPAKAVTLGAAYDYQANGLFDNSYANAVAGYLSFQLTEKLKFNARGEYATGSPGAFGTATGERAELLGVTGTLDYALWAQAITRLECRWDHDLSNNKIYGPNDKNDAVSLALNVIFKY